MRRVDISALSSSEAISFCLSTTNTPPIFALSQPAMSATVGRRLLKWVLQQQTPLYFAGSTSCHHLQPQTACNRAKNKSPFGFQSKMLSVPFWLS
ncbi:hypothetical protein Fmac_001085 [Flemingia macrophylla]|uniref:Uncharacterized protein n=1 Tax=Flemingia macrophylla TaxID=520843 RepID=A0ABD1NG34_9FABA